MNVGTAVAGILPRRSVEEGNSEMTWWIWTIIAVYLVGFVFFLFLNLNIGPLTLGLCLLRALLWPLWVTTGIPHGTPLTMD
jgi:hypothetical protein